MKSSVKFKALWNETLAGLKGRFWSSLAVISVPIVLMALLLFLGPITSYLSLLLCPLVLPFLYNGYRNQWSARDAKVLDDPWTLKNYTERPGSRGCFGLLYPTILVVLLMDVINVILIGTCLFPLLRAFGYESIANELEMAANDIDISTFVNKFMEPGVQSALSGPYTVIYGIGAFIGVAVWLMWTERARFSYVLMTRILPDCENNLSGTQIRAIGRTFMYGYYWKHVGLKAMIVGPFFAVGVLLYGGAIAGFSFISTSQPVIVGSLPIVIVGIIMIPAFLLDAASEVPVADTFMRSMKENSSQSMIDAVYGTFRNPVYRHTPEKAGQTPFQGMAANSYEGAVEKGAFDASGFYQPGKKAEPKNRDDVNPTAVDTTSEQKTEETPKKPRSGAYFFDFSKDSKPKKDDNEKPRDNNDGNQ